MVDRFVSLINKYRSKEDMSDRDRRSLYFYIDNYTLKLAHKHYKQFQQIWYMDTMDKQQHRIMMFYDFVRENSDRTPEYLFKAFNSRFLWVEFLVECKILGIQLFGYDVPLTKQITSATIRHIITGLRLVRNFEDKYGIEPTYEELCIEYIRYNLQRGKMVKWSVVNRVVLTILKFLYCKRYTNPLEKYDEEYFRKSG